MRVSDANYIIVKGVYWLESRFDAIGYSTPCSKERMCMIKRIWYRDKTVPNEFVKRIIGSDADERRKDTIQNRI